MSIKFVLACHPWGVSTCRFVYTGIFHFILKHFKYPYFFDGITLRPTATATDLYKPTQNTKDDNPARLPVFICMYLKVKLLALVDYMSASGYINPEMELVDNPSTVN